MFSSPLFFKYLFTMDASGTPPQVKYEEEKENFTGPFRITEKYSC